MTTLAKTSFENTSHLINRFQSLLTHPDSLTPSQIRSLKLALLDSNLTLNESKSDL
jgi:hypothetical protein